jgi:hypothetical protein
MDNYLICFNRVYCGETVGQGNRFVEMNKATKENVEAIIKEIEKESKDFSDNNYKILDSVVIITNIIKLDL